MHGNFNCTMDQFTCLEEKTKKCLPLTWVCDGTADCANASDEKACSKLIFKPKLTFPLQSYPVQVKGHCK
ncbi:unnamed protein product, partial [Allacma fusca]